MSDSKYTKRDIAFHENKNDYVQSPSYLYSYDMYNSAAKLDDDSKLDADAKSDYKFYDAKSDYDSKKYDNHAKKYYNDAKSDYKHDDDDDDDDDYDNMPELIPDKHDMSYDYTVSEELKITVVSMVPDKKVMLDAPFINIFAKIEKDGFIYLFTGIGYYFPAVKKSNFDEIFDIYNKDTKIIFDNDDIKKKLKSKITTDITQKNSQLLFNNILWDTAELNGTAYNFHKSEFLVYSTLLSRMVLETMSTVTEKTKEWAQQIGIKYTGIDPEKTIITPVDTFLIRRIAECVKDMHLQKKQLDDFIDILSNSNIKTGGGVKSLLGLFALAILSSQSQATEPISKVLNTTSTYPGVQRWIGMTPFDIKQTKNNFEVITKNINKLVDSSIMPHEGFTINHAGYFYGEYSPSLENTIKNLVEKYPSLKNDGAHTTESVLQNIITSLMKEVKIETTEDGIRITPSEIHALSVDDTNNLINQMNDVYDTLISNKKAEINGSPYNSKNTYYYKNPDLVGKYEKFIDEWNFDTAATIIPAAFAALSKIEKQTFLNDLQEYSLIQVKKTYFNHIIVPLIERSRSQILYSANSIAELEDKMKNQIEYIEEKFKKYENQTGYDNSLKDLPELIANTRQTRHKLFEAQIASKKILGKLNQEDFEVSISIYTNYFLAGTNFLTTIAMIFIFCGLKVAFLGTVGVVGVKATPVLVKAASKTVNAGIPWLMELLSKGTKNSITEISKISVDNLKEGKRLLEELYSLPKEQLTSAIEMRKTAIKKKQNEESEENKKLQAALKKVIDELQKQLDEMNDKQTALAHEIDKFLKNAIENITEDDPNNTWTDVSEKKKENHGNGPGGGKRTRNVNRYLKNKRYVKTKRIKNHNKTKNLKKKNEK